MNQFYTVTQIKRVVFLLCLLSTSFTFSYAQGWPKDYKGVMLQGFYWDSYQDSQWSNLESQADELSKYFSLIWVPQSGYCNTMSNQMGYAPIWWFKHDSAFGKESALRQMIKTFKAKGTGIIEDVVINHRSGNTNWCDFPTEQWNGKTYTWSLADICNGDDQGETKKAGYNVTGNNDTGDDFKGSRDIDHSSQNAQNNIKAYLEFLLKDLGYAGFRYDMVKGYAPNFIGIYNTSAKPTYSVGEYWDNTSSIKSWINGTKVNDVPTSAAFDFPMKYLINKAFGSNNEGWNNLNEATIARDDYYKQYSVTFIDNHDTYRQGQGGSAPLYAHIEAANAYILSMPGTPCVFLRHWQQYKTAIKRLIAVRRAVGVANTSQILESKAENKGFVLKVKGDKGELLLLLGGTINYNIQGMTLATQGEDYKVYVSSNVNLNEVKEIKDELSSFVAPRFCKVNDGETCAFFEKPKNWQGNVKCWAWNATENFTTGKWPGSNCVKVGTTHEGFEVWKWTWDGKAYANNLQIQAKGKPTGIIFSANTQTSDMSFENGAYYASDYSKKGVITGINIMPYNSKRLQQGYIYTIDGRIIGKTSNIKQSILHLPSGIYI